MKISRASTAAALGCAAALFAMLVTGPAGAQPPSRPAKCDELSSSFETGPRKTLSALHQSALTLGDQRSDEAAAKAAQLLPGLRSLMADIMRREGARSVSAALLKSDIADLAFKLAQPDHDLIKRLRQEAFDVLVNAGTLETLEVSLRLDGLLNSQSTPVERYAHALRRLQAHRQAAGDVVRASPLWQSDVVNAPTIADKERLLREQLAVAVRVGHAKWALQTRSDLLSAVIELRTGWKTAVHDNKGSFRSVLEQNARRAPEILQLARQIAPELEARLGWPKRIDGAPCSWLPTGVDVTAQVIISLGEQAERAPALRLVVLSAADGAFETDYVGSLSNMSAVLAARSVDKELYLQGMAAAAIGSWDSCDISKEIPALCSLRSLASSYASMAAAPQGIPLLLDAIALAEEKGASAETKALLIVECAELEWRAGTAAEASKLLDRAERLLLANPSLAETEVSIKAVRLRALIADAQLDDRLALQSFDRLVRIAIDLNTRRSREHPSTMSGNSGASRATDVSHAAARELVHRHVRRRFCVDCGEVAGGAPPAIAWLRAVFMPTRESGLVPSMEDFLLLRALPVEAWSVEMQRAATDRFKATLALQSGEVGKGALPALAEIRRLLPAKTDEPTLLRTVALAGVIPDTMGDAGGIKAFMAFLLERDLARKRALWATFYRTVASSTSDQFGTDADFYDQTDALARGLQASDYGLAARVVFESLVDKIADGASTGTLKSKDSLQTLTINSGVAVPALTRIASFAIQRKEWALAHRLLDLAGAVARERLTTEWGSGNDRVSAGLNDLRPAIRLTAQLRADLLTDAASRQAVPDGQAKLFADLQMAMFSDTAAVAQAVDRRRIAANPALASAIKRRDEAASAIAASEKFRFVSELYSLTSVADEVKALARVRDASAAEATRLMPVAEDALSPAPVSLDEAQRSLGAGEAVLLLHAGSHAVYGQLIKRGEPPVAWISKLTVQELERRIKSVRAGIDVSAGSLPQFPFDEAFALHEILLGPAAGALADIRHLLVMADGPLNSLPLAILPTAAVTTPPITPDEIRAMKIPWLIRKHALTTLTSMGSLRLRGAKPLASRARIAFAGIGNPVLTGAPGTFRGIELGQTVLAAGRVDIEALRRLPSLPETATEIETLGKTLNASKDDLRIGAAATETAVKRMALADYRIITFATHGLVAGAVKGAAEPGLVLTPPITGTEEDDGFLGASEISALKLDADLVVLSACNTASSDGRPRAEGLSGLARSFLAAGARGIVATHWAIPSKPAVELTTRMVSARSSNPEGGWGSSLRTAMLAVIDDIGAADFAHPANWGAFVAVGLAGDK